MRTSGAGWPPRLSPSEISESDVATRDDEPGAHDGLGFATLAFNNVSGISR